MAGLCDSGSVIYGSGMEVLCELLSGSGSLVQGCFCAKDFDSPAWEVTTYIAHT